MSLDLRNPTFEEVQKLSRNGKQRIRVLIYGASVECRAKVYRTRAEIDFDLFSCNYDLRPEASELLFDEYNRYREDTGFRTRMHPHFSCTSIWFDVHRVDAEKWFQPVLRALQDPNTVALCDAALEFGGYLQKKADELLIGVLIEVRDKADGETVVLACSPKTDPGVMRVSAALRGLKEILDEQEAEASFSGADYSEVA